MPAPPQHERSDALGEGDAAPVGERVVEHVVVLAVEHEGRHRARLEEARHVLDLPRAERALVGTPRRAQVRGIGEGLGHELDVLGREVPGRGPQPVAVHRRDPRATALRGVELGDQRVAVGALPDEVVGREPLLARPLGRDARSLEELGAQGDDRVEEAHAHGLGGRTQRVVVADDAAEVAADEHDAVVPEHVVDQRVEVEGVRGDVVVAVGGEVRVAEAAQVGSDDLEAGLGERADVAPPDPLRLRVAVHEQDRDAPGSLVHERQVHSVAHLGASYRERVRIRCRHDGSLGMTVTTYEPVIGLEVHVELSTASKLFCGCPNEFGGEPNTHVCPVCLGLPGSLPVLNERAVEYALRLAEALHFDVPAHVDLRPEELLLSGHAEGLPGQPVRGADPHERLARGRRHDDRHRARPPRRGHGQDACTSAAGDASRTPRTRSSTTTAPASR